MPALVLTDARVEINSVNLSDHVRSVTLNYEGDLQEDTAMGDTTRTRLSGLKDWSVEVTFKQNFDSGSVDETLFSLVGGAAVAIKVRPTTSAIGATNPEYQGNVILQSYPPLGNAVGELSEVTASFQADGALTRAVA